MGSDPNYWGIKLFTFLIHFKERLIHTHPTRCECTLIETDSFFFLFVIFTSGDPLQPYINISLCRFIYIIAWMKLQSVRSFVKKTCTFVLMSSILLFCLFGYKNTVTASIRIVCNLDFAWTYFCKFPGYFIMPFGY